MMLSVDSENIDLEGEYESSEKCEIGKDPGRGFSMGGKTPVSLLQELCVKMQLTPKYDLVQIEGSVHEPTFRYRVAVGEFIEYGSGQSKKKAKHAAARAILQVMIKSGRISESSISAIPLNKDIMMAPFDDGIEGNPVGALQELCMARRWPPPVYEMIAEEGLPHERNFKLAVIVGKHREIGAGKSKKLAKRQAAHRMMQVLHDELPPESRNGTLLEDDDELSHLGFGGARGSRKDRGSSHHTQRISQAHRDFLPRLSLETCATLEKGVENPVDRLESLGIEHIFDITYIDIEETTKSGKRLCLVQLATHPISVCHGSGVDMEEAKKDAALRALSFLASFPKLKS